MQMSGMQRSLAAGAAALVLVGGALGVAAAQQTPTPPAQGQNAQPAQAQAQNKRDQFIAALAKRLNVTPDQLKQAFDGARQDVGLPPRPQGGPGRLGGGEGHGSGGARGMPGAPMLREGLAAAAQAIGITPDQLRQELPGKSLADVARARNVDPQKVVDALVKAATDRIDQALSAGRIPADRAAQLKQNLSQMIQQMVNRQLPPPGQRQPGQQPPANHRPGAELAPAGA